MTNRLDQTRAVYDQVATEYAARIAGELDGKPLDRAFLEVFASTVDAGGRVCDAGCGPGHVARFLHDLGVSVYGIDLAPAMVAEALRLNPGIEFRTGDLTTLSGEPTDLAGIVAFYSLIHLPRERVASVLETMRHKLRPGGLVFIAFHIGTDELHIDEWWGHDVSLDFTFFGIQEMRGYLLQAGFELDWVFERAPYPGVEHPTRRAHMLARTDVPTGVAST